MKGLAIETATVVLGVAVVDETRVLAAFDLLAERTHSAELPIAVQRVLAAAGETIGSLDGFVIDIGPGSFTGLRIGTAFLKALAFRTGKPVAAIPSLDVIAANMPWAPQTIVPVLDARQKKVYAAVYQTAGGWPERRTDHQLLTPEELIAQLPAGPIVLIGDGAALYRDRFVQALGDRAVFADPALALPRAAILGRLGLRKLAKGDSDKPNALTPLYLHPMTCTVRGSATAADASKSPVSAPQIHQYRSA